MHEIIFPNLAQEMKARNLSFAKLADMIGLSKTAMYRRVYGKTDWKLHEIVNICRVLDSEDALQLFLRLHTKS